MHVARLSQLGFFSALFFASEARWCANDKTGICEVNDLGGWCFHDKKTGEFTCDDESYCRNQSTLFGKINVAGCFTKEGNIRCCCNVGQLCNPQLVYQQPEIPSTSGQKCSYLQEDPREETVIYKDCQEKWCIAFMYNTEDKGSPVVINRGCESRFLLKHIQNKAMDDEFHNNTQWKKTDIAFKKPRCSEIVKESVPWLNDTQQQCLDFDYMSESGTKLKAKMCCCRGRDNCNAEFKWKDPAVTLSQIWTDGKTENASISVSIFTVFWDMLLPT
ncbi:hypothetical protein L596_008565 [Steinernema carpocapsae]|uniref:Uncharacterized protein n=1 Tax=Steinernema carpocapsae TaxID=34508 RepID=A0A4U5PDY6_STECR|nr:hypothetical protein L596_008565 [Steinernema carpocapsae]